MDITFCYIINGINDYGDLTVWPTLNLDYCLLIVKLSLWMTFFIWKTMTLISHHDMCNDVLIRKEHG